MLLYWEMCQWEVCSIMCCVISGYFHEVLVKSHFYFPITSLSDSIMIQKIKIGLLRNMKYTVYCSWMKASLIGIYFAKVWRRRHSDWMTLGILLIVYGTQTLSQCEDTFPLMKWMKKVKRKKKIQSSIRKPVSYTTLSVNVSMMAPTCPTATTFGNHYTVLLIKEQFYTLYEIYLSWQLKSRLLSLQRTD